MNNIFKHKIIVQQRSIFSINTNKNVFRPHYFLIIFKTTGIIGHVSQISTEKISLYIFRTIKASFVERNQVFPV